MNHAEYRILIVEDDATMLRGLTDTFARTGYQVFSAKNGAVGLDLALTLKPDLLLLDVMLPEVNGYEILRHLRSEGFSTPAILLTARDEESDVLLGLGLGADDYVTKPFRIRELLARCEALLRRATNLSTPKKEGLRFGDFTLDRGARELRHASEGVVELSPKEYELLEYLCSKPGNACSRDEIMAAVWGYDALVTLRSIDRFVTTLRKKIEPNPSSPRFLLTIREYGYKFHPDA